MPTQRIMILSHPVFCSSATLSNWALFSNPVVTPLRSQVPFTLICKSCAVIIPRSLCSHVSSPGHTFLLCDLFQASLGNLLSCSLPRLSSSPWMTWHPLEPAWNMFFYHVNISITLENIALLTVALDTLFVQLCCFCSDADLIELVLNSSLLRGWL